MWASFLYSSSYEPNNDRSRVRPTSSDSMKTLQWPVSRLGSGVSRWLSLYSWRDFWEAPSEWFPIFSPVPSDETVLPELPRESCCSVRMGWPKRTSGRVFGSSGFFRAWPEFFIVRKHEDRSMPLDLDISVLFTVLLGVKECGKLAKNGPVPGCWGLLRWRSGRDGA